jgi:hypothetical protein
MLYFDLTFLFSIALAFGVHLVDNFRQAISADDGVAVNFSAAFYAFTGHILAP